MKKSILAPFLQLLAKLNHRVSISNYNPPVTCIVSDRLMIFTTEAAQQLGIPIIKFFPFSACGFMGFKHSRTLVEKGIIPLKGMKGVDIENEKSHQNQLLKINYYENLIKSDVFYFFLLILYVACMQTRNVSQMGLWTRS